MHDVVAETLSAGLFGVPTGIRTVGKFVSQFEAAISSTQLPDQALAELQADVTSVKAQLASPTPKHSLVRECLLPVRHVLEHPARKIAGTIEASAHKYREVSPADRAVIRCAQ